MNTKYYFDRRLVLTISVLLAMLWLPLTTFAKDLSEAADSQSLQNCEKSHSILKFSTESISRDLDDAVGFAETDPTIRQPRDAKVFPHATNNLTQQQNAGFAEIDPAGQLAPIAVNNLQVSNRGAQWVYIGFSESDPASNIYFSQIEKDFRHEHC